MAQISAPWLHKALHKAQILLQSLGRAQGTISAFADVNWLNKNYVLLAGADKLMMSLKIYKAFSIDGMNWKQEEYVH